ncbi:MAG: hypothetical protein IJK89_01645 [Clostridia bacterium]|nr:hypothetical protein [Clostridia bacterium]
MKTEDILYALTDVDERDIDAAKNGRRVRFTPKKIVALAAALAVLLACAVPVAAAPVSRPAYELVYAVSPALAQRLKPVRRSDVKEGIQMEVISAQISGAKAEILVAFRDLEGDRIDATTDLFDSYMIRSPYDAMGTCRFESYDEATGTAVYTVLMENMGGKPYKGDKITFSVYELLTGKRDINGLTLPLDLSGVSRDPALTDNADYRGGSYADTPGIEDRLSSGAIRQLGSVLAADPADERMLAEGVYLTAAGYTDGFLRVQLRFTDILRTDNHGFLWLEDAQGNRTEPLFSESFWAEGHLNNGTGNNDSFEEYVFEIPEDRLAEYVVKGDLTTANGGPIVGNWEITFPLEQAQ